MASRQSAKKKTQQTSTRRELYPPLSPYRVGFLKVSALHELYFEESGNPDGRAALAVCLFAARQQ